MILRSFHQGTAVGAAAAAAAEEGHQRPQKTGLSTVQVKSRLNHETSKRRGVSENFPTFRGKGNTRHVTDLKVLTRLIFIWFKLV